MSDGNTNATDLLDLGKFCKDSCPLIYLFTDGHVHSVAHGYTRSFLLFSPIQTVIKRFLPAWGMVGSGDEKVNPKWSVQNLWCKEKGDEWKSELKCEGHQICQTDDKIRALIPS